MQISKFRHQYDKPERVYSVVGSPEHIVYTPRYDDYGVLQLVETGRENIYDAIQSHKDSVDIHVILKRFSEGDVDVLSQVQGVYGDFLDMPKTYAEVLNSVIDGERRFQNLPVEIRKKFNNNFAEFMSAMDQPDFLARMGVESEPSPATSATPSSPAPAEGGKES